MQTDQKDRHTHDHDQHDQHDHDRQHDHEHQHDNDHEHGDEEPDIPEDQKEAEHFCDVIAHFENYGSNCFQKFQQMETDF